MPLSLRDDGRRRPRARLALALGGVASALLAFAALVMLPVAPTYALFTARSETAYNGVTLAEDFGSLAGFGGSGEEEAAPLAGAPPALTEQDTAGPTAAAPEPTAPSSTSLAEAGAEGLAPAAAVLCSLEAELDRRTSSLAPARLDPSWGSGGGLSSRP